MFDALLLALALLWGGAVVLFIIAIGRTYLFREQLHALEAAPVALPPLTLIIPARNEEHNIGICLAAITTLDYPPERLQVIVVNDHSTDATRAEVMRYAERFPYIELLDATDLLPGWSGKSHGCWLGARRAAGEWLLFIDADTYVKPQLLRSVVALAAQRQLEMLSVIPFQIAHSWQERLWLPGLFLGIAASVDFRRVNDPDDPYALANGQFLMFRRDVYERIGGHQAIRGELSDDLAFATLAKAHHLRYHCLFGDTLVETRMYRSLAEIRRGFAKNLAEIMYADSWRVIVAHALKSAGVGLGYMVLPPLLVLAWCCSATELLPLTATIVVALTLLLAVTFAATARELRIPLRYTLAFGLGLLLHALLLISSFRNKQNGRREWKGRYYNS